jgi:hypothetical protein
LGDVGDGDGDQLLGLLVQRARGKCLERVVDAGS